MSSLKTFFICLPVFFAVAGAMVGLTPQSVNGIPLNLALSLILLGAGFMVPIVYAYQTGDQLLANRLNNWGIVLSAILYAVNPALWKAVATHAQPITAYIVLATVIMLILMGSTALQQSMSRN